MQIYVWGFFKGDIWTTGSEDNLLYYLKLFSNIGFCIIKPLIK